MPHPSGVLQAYEPAQIERIMNILVRASEDGGQIDNEDVEQSLLELFAAIGLVSDGTEEVRLWQEFSSEEPPHKAERDGFLQLTKAEDPFELARRDSGLSSLLPRIFGIRRIVGRWQKPGYSMTSIHKTDWKSLSDADQAEFRKMLEDSASYYARFVKRGPKQKTKIDTALLCLADLFQSWTGQGTARHHVAYSAESQFIQFATAALEPVGWYFEVSRSALSGRWERTVLHERTGEHVFGEALLEQEPEQKP